MKSWKTLLGLAVSAFLIWFTLRGVSLSEVWGFVRSSNFWLLGAAVAVTTGSFLIRAIRWHLLLQPVKADSALNSRFGAVTIGFMVNNLLPARVGEMVRAYAFSRMESVAFSGAFGSVVVERFLDGLVLIGFLVIPVLLPGSRISENVPALGVLLRFAILGLVVLCVLFVVMLFWPDTVMRTAERALTRLPAATSRRVLAELRSFLDSFRVLRKPGLLVPALFWSVAHWSWNVFSFYLAMAAFGIHLGFAAAMFTQAVVGFVVALPAGPGFFGTFHYAVGLSLVSGYGVNAARAQAFAYSYHLGGFIPVTLIGLWYAHRLGLSLGELGKKGSGIADDGPKRP